MKVVVFGASGKVGQLVVQRLLDEGNEVWGFVYGDSRFAESAQLHIIQGDVHKFDDVREAVEHADVVVSTLGSWGTKQKDILSSGMVNIIQAMTEHGIDRIVSLTGADALSPEDKPSLISHCFHALISLSPARKILADGEKHIQLLADSGLNWTVLRSPIMNEKGNPAQVSVGLLKPKPWETIHRHSVVDAIVDLISDKRFQRASPYIRRSRS